MVKSPSSDPIVSPVAGIPAAKAGSCVYVIDDESEVRKSLHFLLSTAGLVSWPFASAQDFLDNLNDLSPAPILLDIRMPNLDGIELMTMLPDRGVNWPIIVISAHGDIQVAVKSIKLGAIEFLEKPFEFEALEPCLQSAFVQLESLHDRYALRNAARERFALLSPRETEVITVLIRGTANKTAAHLLDLSVRTVEMHRANALSKLKVKSLAEVVHLASDAEMPLGVETIESDTAET